MDRVICKHDLENQIGGFNNTKIYSRELKGIGFWRGVDGRDKAWGNRGLSLGEW